MQSARPLDKNIQFLIGANYQRMVTFEQAAFLTNEPSFKKIYQEKADESEINIQQLYIILDASNPVSLEKAQLSNNTPDPMLASMFNGKKNTLKILESVKQIEKTIAKWYKTTLKEINDLPEGITSLVEAQYKMLHTAQLQMDRL